MTDSKKSFVVFRENPSIYVLKFSPLNRESVAWLMEGLNTPETETNEESEENP